MAEPESGWAKAAEKYVTSSWHSNANALERLIAIARPEGGRVLDVATGAGHVALAFAQHVSEVVALDYTQEMLDVTLRSAEERGLRNVSCVLGDALNLSMFDEEFDGVVCRVAPHHFPSIEPFLRESFRVLKPGGWFVLADTVGCEDAEGDEIVDRVERMRDPSHVRNYLVSHWLRSTSDAGFVLEFHEVISKPLHAQEWMDRMSVKHSVREEIYELILNSGGAAREYLRPTGNRDDLIFHLDEIALRAHKPNA